MSWPISRHPRELVVAIIFWDFSNEKFSLMIKTKKMDQYLTIRGERKEVESNLDIRCLPEHCTNKIKLWSVDLWCLRVGTTASISQFSSGVASWCSSIRIPWQCTEDGRGYFEDRRPASNNNPYKVTEQLSYIWVVISSIWWTQREYQLLRYTEFHGRP